MRLYDFFDDGVTVRGRFEPYYSEMVGMHLYGVNSGIARGNLVSGNGSGVYIWDNGGVKSHNGGGKWRC